MLSDVDLTRKFCKGIIIFPFIPSNLEGGSLFITASNLAWSKGKSESIEIDNKIHIPKNDTAIIISKESISLSNKYACTCHSCVLNGAIGLGHVSTSIKPGSVGRLLISIHNNTDKEVILDVGEKIAVIMFHQLSSPAKNCLDKNHVDPSVLTRLGIKLTQSEWKELSDTKYRDNKELEYLLKNCDEFKEYKKKYCKKLDYKIKLIIPIILLLITLLVIMNYLTVVPIWLNVLVSLLSTCIGIIMGKIIT